MSSQQSDPDNPNLQMKRRKRGDSRNSRQTPRYVCYCDKVYLSYPALYLHLKNKHPECFMNNRKIQTTKFKESITVDGYKILKMQKEANQPKSSEVYEQEHGFKPKNLPSFPFHSYNPFPYSVPPDLMMPPIESKHPYYTENPLNNIQMPKSIPQNVHQSIPESMSPYPSVFQRSQKSTTDFKPQIQIPIKQSRMQAENVLTLINLYIEERTIEEQLQKREIMEMQLLFSLLPKCIREKSQKLKSLSSIKVDPSQDLVKNTDLKYLENVLAYFRDSYVPNFVEKQKSSDEATLSRQQIFMKSMVRLNQLFNDLDLTVQQLQNFEQWLIKKNLIENVNFNVVL